MPDTPDATTKDGLSATFELLTSTRRRGVLYTLQQTGPTTLDTLAHTIADWESTGNSEAKPETVKTSLRHSHLPKLNDAGVIDYDHSTGKVTLDDNAEAVENFLHSARENRPDNEAPTPITHLQ